MYKLLEGINFLNGKALELVLVSQNGKSCSRCLFADHCIGCVKLDPTDDKKEFILQPTDTICLSFSGDLLCQVLSFSSELFQKSIFILQFNNQDTYSTE